METHDFLRWVHLVCLVTTVFRVTSSSAGVLPAGLNDNITLRPALSAQPRPSAPSTFRTLMIEPTRPYKPKQSYWHTPLNKDPQRGRSANISSPSDTIIFRGDGPLPFVNSFVEKSLLRSAERASSWHGSSGEPRMLSHRKGHVRPKGPAVPGASPKQKGLRRAQYKVWDPRLFPSWESQSENALVPDVGPRLPTLNGNSQKSPPDDPDPRHAVMLDRYLLEGQHDLPSAQFVPLTTSRKTQPFNNTLTKGRSGSGSPKLSVLEIDKQIENILFTDTSKTRKPADLFTNGRRKNGRKDSKSNKPAVGKQNNFPSAQETDERSTDSDLKKEPQRSRSNKNKMRPGESRSIASDKETKTNVSHNYALMPRTHTLGPASSLENHEKSLARRPRALVVMTDILATKVFGVKMPPAARIFPHSTLSQTSSSSSARRHHFDTSGIFQPLDPHQGHPQPVSLRVNSLRLGSKDIDNPSRKIVILSSPIPTEGPGAVGNRLDSQRRLTGSIHLSALSNSFAPRQPVARNQYQIWRLPPPAEVHKSSARSNKTVRQCLSCFKKAVDKIVHYVPLLYVSNSKIRNLNLFDLKNFIAKDLLRLNTNIVSCLLATVTAFPNDPLPGILRKTRSASGPVAPGRDMDPASDHPVLSDVQSSASKVGSLLRSLLPGVRISYYDLNHTPAFSASSRPVKAEDHEKAKQRHRKWREKTSRVVSSLYDVVEKSKRPSADVIQESQPTALDGTRSSRSRQNDGRMTAPGRSSRHLRRTLNVKDMREPVKRECRRIRFDDYLNLEVTEVLLGLLDELFS